MNARYAVYFSPADQTPLAEFGQRVLGRDANGNPTNFSSEQFPNNDVVQRLQATPAHYGFHATLKPPFVLQAKASESQLLHAVEHIAAETLSVKLTSLYPRVLHDFAALTLNPAIDAVDNIAFACVERLERFREPLSVEDMARRQQAQLNDMQTRYLMQYGYPYVKSEFRFHMTLTGKLNLEQDAAYLRWLELQYRELLESPPTLNRLSVFFQPDRTTAFTRLAEFELK